MALHITSLSPRENEILVLVTCGRTTKEIAGDLAIAESTVNWHVSNAITKLGASTRAEAVAKALRGDVPDPLAPTPVRRRTRRRAFARWMNGVAAALRGCSRPETR